MLFWVLIFLGLVFVFGFCFGFGFGVLGFVLGLEFCLGCLFWVFWLLVLGWCSCCSFSMYLLDGLFCCSWFFNGSWLLLVEGVCVLCACVC